MGRTCQICGRSRPNEQFGGKGERASTCSKCRHRPKEERRRILAIEEVHGLLNQSRISAKNIKRLEELVAIDDAEFQSLRSLVLQIATVRPGKRRRWKAIQQQHADLFKQIVDCGFFDYLLDQYDCDLTLDDFGITEDPITEDPIEDVEP